MSSIFSKIVAGDIPAYKVAESNDFLAFLDISPLTEGHTLVIPKKEVDQLFDLDDETYTGLQLFAKIVATGLKKATDVKRIGVVVMGLEVPHAHIHLIPMNKADDINFSNDKLKYTPEEFETIANAIKDALREEREEEV
ncbi:HIT family protein [Mucilaginibacter myungsuensis]|uniref:HIT family protein n=1 Tax=Mucilaginibacter myungsuensis TaxID=649104 RepID=A0A929PVM3_9SPHI|nr:HIT family protein [Mucilaginibacter myungsuensis]MBE9661176.1 HIT family protein [Mucilaginibacter myungsuensis]MDN3597321.1 HIT family protein [Mucilaginibacter myungsuensis]